MEAHADDAAAATRTPTADYAFFVGSPREGEGEGRPGVLDRDAGVDEFADSELVDAVVDSPHGAKLSQIDEGNGMNATGDSDSEEGEGDEDEDEEVFRYVHINAPEENAALGYCSNTVVTSRFTLYNFLPKLLFYEFSKLANAYFLVISIMQTIKPISNTGGFPASLPALSIIVLIDMFFACLEDYKRHKADHVSNNLPCLKYDLASRSFQSAKWHTVQVGDILKVHNRESVPADMVILGASEPEPENPAGICYVETKSLDGETNLKLRQGLEVTYTTMLSDHAVGDLQGVVVCETPNNSIHRFSGSMTLKGGAKEVITTNAIILRGSNIRNTEFIYGLVVNTGPDTKIMMASSNTPIKWSNMERRLNQQIRYICFLMVALCLVGAICSTAWNHSNLGRTRDAHAWYLFDSSATAVKSPAGNFFVMVLYYFLLLNSFIPVSLYVSMTSVKFMQAYFMNNDLEMYHAETDTPFQVRTMSLNEELGQIDYVFSDKTGTLTCNIMEFRKCTINGVAYGMGETEVGIAARRRQQEEDGLSSFHAVTPFNKQNESAPDRVIKAPYVNYQDDSIFEALSHKSSPQADRINQFFEHLSVCHTVMPERASDGSLRLSASSPDEQALVAAAGCFGYKFVSRAPGKAMIEYFSTIDHPEYMTDPQPNSENPVGAYQILEVLEFNSTRKRMSAIVKSPDGALKLFCKGADTVMYERLRKTTDTDALRTRKLTLKHMEEFASEGLRTLVIGVADIDPSFYESWVVRYRTAINDMRQIALRRDGEENDIDRLMEEIETNLEVLGATAIEDRLQAEVPNTIYKLRQASIKVWMLTGDKEETAINIGYACRLLSSEIERLVISADTHTDLESIVEELESCAREREQMDAMCQEEADRATPVTASTSSGAASSITPNATRRRLTRIESMATVRQQLSELALIIDGETLELALDECPELLLRVAEQCVAVIACRVSPAQKAQLVQLVRDNKPEVRTLAIGDGANDVSMIQAAHVGVGISGLEGMQAANSSDYSIAQFRFLSRMLFVHGRWNYVRMGKLILYIFYKNVVLNLTQFWYMAYGGFSGQKFFLEWGLQGYNLLFTALPIVLVATFEQDVPADLAHAFPLLYRIGQENRHFNTKVVWSWISSCVWESVVICFGTLYGMRYLVGLGETPTMWVYGCAAFSIALLVVTLKLALHQQMWWKPIHIPIFVGSFALWLGTAAFISHGKSVSSAYWNGVFTNTFGADAFWLIVPIIVFTALSRDLLTKGYIRAFCPTYKHLAQEVHAFGLTPIADKLLAFPPPEKMPQMVPGVDIEAASSVSVLGDVTKPPTTTPGAVTAPTRPLIGRIGRTGSSSRHLRPTRGSAFSYDAESVMVESFIASERFRNDNPQMFRSLFDRHASRGSMAFHNMPDERARAMRGRELLAATTIDEGAERQRSTRATTTAGDFAGEPSLSASQTPRQSSAGNVFRAARHSKGRRRFFSAFGGGERASLVRGESSSMTRRPSARTPHNRSTIIGGSADALGPRSSLHSGGYASAPRRDRAPSEDRSFLRNLLRSFSGAPSADAVAVEEAVETPRPTPRVRRYAHSTSQRQLHRQATL